MKNLLSLLFHPFMRIAGWSSLVWGLSVALLATIPCYYAGLHYHHLLHYGPALNPAWWCYVVEHLVIWVVPATIFYGAGLALSRSKIRCVDVFGTVAFAEIPLALFDVIATAPSVRHLNQCVLTTDPTLLLQDPMFVWGVVLTLMVIPVVVLMLIWLFQALKVSCNLQGRRLWITYLIGLVASSFLTRALLFPMQF